MATRSSQEVRKRPRSPVAQTLEKVPRPLSSHRSAKAAAPTLFSKPAPTPRSAPVPPSDPKPAVVEAGKCTSQPETSFPVASSAPVASVDGREKQTPVKRPRIEASDQQSQPSLAAARTLLTARKKVTTSDVSAQVNAPSASTGSSSVEKPVLPGEQSCWDARKVPAGRSAADVKQTSTSDGDNCEGPAKRRRLMAMPLAPMTPPKEESSLPSQPALILATTQPSTPLVSQFGVDVKVRETAAHQCEKASRDQQTKNSATKSSWRFAPWFPFGKRGC